MKGNAGLLAALLGIVAVALWLGIPLVDDGQLDSKSVAPECLEVHRLAYCQDKGAEWGTQAEDDAIVSYYDAETGTIQTGHLWEVEGNDKVVTDNCDVLGDAEGAKYIECALEGSR